jgi:hypothetical protein
MLLLCLGLLSSDKSFDFQPRSSTVARNLFTFSLQDLHIVDNLASSSEKNICVFSGKPFVSQALWISFQGRLLKLRSRICELRRTVTKKTEGSLLEPKIVRNQKGWVFSGLQKLSLVPKNPYYF